MGEQWDYKRNLLFDFWDDFKSSELDKTNSERRENRRESAYERNIRIAFNMSWWSRGWWLDFVVVPLAQKYGLNEILSLSLPEALILKEADGHHEEHKRYYQWKYEKDYKESKENSSNETNSNRVMKSIMPSEKNKKQIANAMSSADNYLGFLRSSRGYNQ